MGPTMAVGDRSVADVLGDVIRNVQEIVRSEVRLFKAGIREEAAQLKSSLLLLVAGGIISFFAVLLLVLAMVFSLALVMPIWAATLTAGAALAIVAGVTLASGVRRFKSLYPPSGQTNEAELKENMEWAQRHTK
jgi:uncharacterized membrane protein YqjE